MREEKVKIKSRGDGIEMDWGRGEVERRSGGDGTERGETREDTWENSHAPAEPWCSWLGRGTHYWCRRKFVPTGNEAASCPAPLWHYLRRMADSGSVSYHPSRPLACPEESSSPAVDTLAHSNKQTNTLVSVTKGGGKKIKYTFVYRWTYYTHKHLGQKRNPDKQRYGKSVLTCPE